VRGRPTGGDPPAHPFPPAFPAPRRGFPFHLAQAVRIAARSGPRKGERNGPSKGLRPALALQMLQGA